MKMTYGVLYDTNNHADFSVPVVYFHDGIIFGVYSRDWSVCYNSLMFREYGAASIKDM